MKIIIIGAGTSGLTSAINLKRLYKNADILIIEHLDKPFKKVLATGNGKCNIGNSNINFELFNNPSFVEKILTSNYLNDEINFLDSIFIKTKNINELIYPVTESAQTVHNCYLREIEKLTIKIHLKESLLNYKIENNRIIVKTNLCTYEADKLIITCGGKSSPKLGSDGSIFPLLKSHGYEISDINPGLCPIVTKEKHKALDGLRIKGIVNLFKNNKLIHIENGEILFKKDGLSGIVIMNISSIISRDLNAKYVIKINSLPTYGIKELETFLNKNGKDTFLNTFSHPLLKDYIYKNNLDPIKTLTNMTFNFDRLYDYEFSQVSVGGISLNNINDDLSSKIENNVSFAGEILNIDGPCGGYNLTWAIISALRIK